jgi:hypothetical protein
MIKRIICFFIVHKLNEENARRESGWYFEAVGKPDWERTTYWCDRCQSYRNV